MISPFGAFTRPPSAAESLKRKKEGKKLADRTGEERKGRKEKKRKQRSLLRLTTHCICIGATSYHIDCGEIRLILASLQLGDSS